MVDLRRTAALERLRAVSKSMVNVTKKAAPLQKTVDIATLPTVSLPDPPSIYPKLLNLLSNDTLAHSMASMYEEKAKEIRTRTELSVQRQCSKLAASPRNSHITPLPLLLENIVSLAQREYARSLVSLENRALRVVANRKITPCGDAGSTASSSQPVASSSRHNSVSSSRSTSSSSSSSGVRSRQSTPSRSRSGTPTSERAAFKTEYAPFLQRYFTYNAYPCGADRSAMAEESGMTASQINVWFQNHRARLRRDAKARGEAAPVLRRVETWERAPLELCLAGMGSVAAARPTMRQVVDDSSEGWDGRSDGDSEDPEPVRDEIMAEKRTRNVLDAVDPPPHAFPARNTLASPTAIRATTAFAFECPWPRTAAPSAPSPPRRAPLSMGELAGRFAGLTTHDAAKTAGDGYADGERRFRNATYCVQPVSRALRTPWGLSCPSSLPLLPSRPPATGRSRLRVSAAFARQAPASFPRPASPVESFSEMESEAESGGPSTPVDAFPVLDLAGVVVAGDDDPLECLFDETAGAW
ncbi:unnamed protein product [Mycena citricolor]|uniref:Homeobox domain-containing protein n=1 Tax=Mycena citricolor TaxID=2018698 RepID=A0AAD2GY44_9AGAR|nr:unnamed protein product [Mycena citricolor]